MDKLPINIDILSNQADASMREKVIAFENEMRKVPQLDLKVEHIFSPGVYSRILHIPKDTILTGHIHKYAQLNILLKGVIEVLIDDDVKRIEAPHIVVSPAGIKRIARAIEDCVWITIHGTDETDLDTIEQKFIAHNEQEYLDFCNTQLQLPFEGNLKC